MASMLGPIAVVVGFALGGLVAAYVVRRLVFPSLLRAAAQTPTTADDRAVAALERPILLWGALLGAHVGVTIVPALASSAHAIQQTIEVVLIVSASWTLGRIAGDVISARTAEANLPSANLIPNLARTGVLMVGALVLLRQLGIEITPILTALGVGGLAVGLALQDTLANLFAGIQILISKQVRVGDFIRLSSGEEGYVADITWRYTTIRQLANNFTIVPNAKLSSAVTANFNMPDLEQAVSVQVGVAYASDLERVERVTVEVARDVMRTVAGGVPAYEPSIRFHTFGDSSINFSVNLRGQDYTAQYLIKHEFIKRLTARYRAEGIDIPFPVRTIVLKGDGAAAPAPPR
ncbi:MAG: mechanosensitive ion channel family protein [Gemmatimonadota bacterium]|nr:mechanosensitive ion channel family protein [Gemmatimonadota bacterium]MDE3216065.1 mechanosensitive ion channel family protein [Gemmatimonadota bacterium]